MLEILYEDNHCLAIDKPAGVLTQGDATGAPALIDAVRVLERERDTTTLELRPLTGRSHQLRVQLASRGLPILGDRKYGGKGRLVARDGQLRVALHARRLAFTHPTRPEVIEVVAAVPADWPAPGRGR